MFIFKKKDDGCGGGSESRPSTDDLKGQTSGLNPMG